MNPQDPVETLTLLSAFEYDFRVAIGDEVRFVAKDLCDMFEIDYQEIERVENDRRAWTLADDGEKLETLGWAPALRLIDRADFEKEDLPELAYWFYLEVIPHIHGEGLLNGTEKIDIRDAQDVKFVREFLAECQGGGEQNSEQPGPGQQS